MDFMVRENRWSNMVRFIVGMRCRLMRSSSILGIMERRVNMGFSIFFLLTKQTKKTTVLLFCTYHRLA